MITNAFLRISVSLETIDMLQKMGHIVFVSPEGRTLLALGNIAEQCEFELPAELQTDAPFELEFEKVQDEAEGGQDVVELCDDKGHLVSDVQLTQGKICRLHEVRVWSVPDGEPSVNLIGYKILLQVDRITFSSKFLWHGPLSSIRRGNAHKQKLTTQALPHAQRMLGMLKTA